MKSAIVFGLVGIGILLLILSGLWTSMFSGTSIWTPEKAARSGKVKDRLYTLAFTLNSPKPNMQAGQDLGAMKAEYEDLKKENDSLNADFKSATESPKTVASMLKWSGISIAAVGLIGWYAVNQSR
jgi:hypothetical protein